MLSITAGGVVEGQGHKPCHKSDPGQDEADLVGFELNQLVHFVFNHFGIDLFFDFFIIQVLVLDFSLHGNRNRQQDVKNDLDDNGCGNTDADKDQHGYCPKF